MTSLEFDSFSILNEKVTSRAFVTLGLTLSSIFVAALYTVFVDFKKAYVKPPNHFPRRTWSALFTTPRVKAPLVEPKEGENYRDLLARASALHPNEAYRIPHHPHEILIIPHRLIEECKNMPESKLSFQQGSYEFFMGVHTGVTNHERATANILKTGVNKIIDLVYGVVQEESLRTVLTQIGECEDWTPVFVLPKAVNMIMAISQRVFVGEPLCRSQEWLHCIFEVTQKAFGSVPALWQYNRFIRPAAAWRMPSLQSVRYHREKAKGLLKPVLDKRLKNMEDPKFEAPPDLMQLVIGATEKTGEGRNLDYQVNAIIGTGRAALFTTAVTIYHLIYDLAMHPECIEPIRQEIQEMGNVPMTRLNVQKLVKLDSFVRESQRFSKMMLVGMIRRAEKPITLSDGTYLPKGVLLGVDTQNAVFDNSTLENPNEFDGFRFSKLRDLPGNEQKFQSVQTSHDHMVYGHGTQACPGRFFAAHEAKVVTSRILTYYDFKLKAPYTKGHPMDTVHGIMTHADPSVEFLFKRRDPGVFPAPPKWD